jgi:Domain of Unknown Function with PDB structure (DUF3857)
MKHVVVRALGLTLTFFLYLSPSRAQPGPPEMQFGGITPEAFAPALYPLDSNANAVYLFDHGVVTYDPAYRGNGYSVVFERHVRLRILNKNALGLATLSLQALRRGNAWTYIDDVRGATYNLEGSKVVVTKLDKSNIFKDKNTDYEIEKIAFPNVREGSVIEYSFRIVYPGYGYIPEWDFQQGYPVLWSQYDITVPQLFDYFVKLQGYRPYTIDSTVYTSNSFFIRFNAGTGGEWQGPDIHRIWALQDILPLEKPEPYTTTLRNHVQKVQFQLAGIRFGDYTKTFRSSWPQLTGELLANADFGGALADRNRWLDDGLQKIEAKGDDPMVTAKKFYAYVRDQFACIGDKGIYLSQPLRKTWEDRRGAVADLNLLLTAMLRHVGFDASPVLLSTRDHGYPVESFPLLSDYNYIVVRVMVGDRYYLLDASRPVIGFGQLSERCYNSTAHAVDSSHDAWPLVPDSVTERRITRLFLSNDSAGGYSGSYSRTLGVFESMDMRTRLKRETPADFFDNLRKSMPDYREMGQAGFDSLPTPEEPLSWYYDMSYHFTQRTLFFNPVLHERLTANPLVEAYRDYPVEMPYRVDNTYLLSMEVPHGYAIEQLPKSARYTLEDSSCAFQYLVSSDGKNIDLQIRLQLKKTIYPVPQYFALRDFYSLIVQKEKEPFIFKKTN